MLAPTDEAPTLPGKLRDRLASAFERGAGHWLLELGIREIGTALPADFAYWRDFAGRYVTALIGDKSKEAVTALNELAKEFRHVLSQSMKLRRV